MSRLIRPRVRPLKRPESSKSKHATRIFTVVFDDVVVSVSSTTQPALQAEEEV
jgi:hypothetical protein